MLLKISVIVICDTPKCDRILTRQTSKTVQRTGISSSMRDPHLCIMCPGLNQSQHFLMYWRFHLKESQQNFKNLNFKSLLSPLKSNSTFNKNKRQQHNTIKLAYIYHFIYQFLVSKKIFYINYIITLYLK